MTEEHHKCIATFLLMQKHRICTEWLSSPLEPLPGDHSQSGYDEDRNRRLSSKHNVFTQLRDAECDMAMSDLRSLVCLVSQFCVHN